MAYTQNNGGAAAKGTFQNERLGGLWTQKAKSGKKYITGTVKINGVETKLIIFPNERKENENQPDFNVYLKEDKAPTQAAPKPAYNKPAYAPRKPVQAGPDPVDDDQLI